MPPDRRVLRAHLTAAGREILTDWDAAINDVEDALFDGFAPSEIAAFSAALERCVANLGLNGPRR